MFSFDFGLKWRLLDIIVLAWGRVNEVIDYEPNWWDGLVCVHTLSARVHLRANDGSTIIETVNPVFENGNECRALQGQRRPNTCFTCHLLIVSFVSKKQNGLYEVWVIATQKHISGLHKTSRNITPYDTGLRSKLQRNASPVPSHVKEFYHVWYFCICVLLCMFTCVHMHVKVRGHLQYHILGALHFF